MERTRQAFLPALVGLDRGHTYYKKINLKSRELKGHGFIAGANEGQRRRLDYISFDGEIEGAAIITCAIQQTVRQIYMAVAYRPVPLRVDGDASASF